MWMEMVGPYLIWMKLFGVLDDSFPGKAAAVTGTVARVKSKSVQADLESMQLVAFALESLKLTDEEVKQMHLPLILASLARKLRESIRLPSFLDILPLVIQCIELIDFILQQLRETMFAAERATSKQSDDAAHAGRKQFTAGMDILAYTREYYGLDGSVQSSDDLRSLDAQGEDGDLSSQMPNPSSITDQPAHMTRPEFDRLRSSVLVQELTSHLTLFTVDLVHDHVVRSAKFRSGLDVDVGEKQLRNANTQIERVLHGVCTSLITVTRAMTRHADKQLPKWKASEQEALTQALLRCCQEGQEYGVVDAGLSTLALIVKEQPFVNSPALKSKVVVKCIMDKVTVLLASFFFC